MHGTKAHYGRGCRCEDCKAENTASLREYRRRERYEKTCPECGEVFTTTVATKVYCCRRCQAYARYPIKDQVCPMCGETFRRGRGKGSHRVYCSTRCKVRARRILGYGIKPEELRQMIADQLYRCPICLDPIDAFNSHVDHCHQSGHVRGVLCRQCNIGLGHFYDDPDRLRRAADFIEESKAPAE